LAPVGFGGHDRARRGCRQRWLDAFTIAAIRPNAKITSFLSVIIEVFRACCHRPCSIWIEFHAPLNNHRSSVRITRWVAASRRIPDRVVFEHVIDVVVHGSGYERIATSGCSDHTIRR
jgi:hypothetical protein